MKKLAEQSNFEIRSVERECQQLKENCLNLQKQLEETKDQREKFQMECKELQWDRKGIIRKFEPKA